MNFNFGDVFTRAWKITWNHKALWLFGVLASCGTGGGSGFSGSSNFNSSDQEPSAIAPPQFLSDWANYFTPQNAVSIVLIIFGVLIVFSLILTAISVIGRIGLIRGAAQATQGDAPTIRELFSGGWPYFWRSFWMWLVIGLPSLFIVLAILIGLLAGLLAFFATVSTDEQAMHLFTFIPILLVCACFTGLFGIVLGLVGQQAQAALVLEDLGIVDSVKRGWGIFRAHLGPILLMWLLLGLMSGFATFLISLPLIVVFIASVFAFIASGDSWLVSLAVSGIALLCYLPIAWLAQGILTAFSQSAWTLTYIELTRKPDEFVNTNHLSTAHD